MTTTASVHTRTDGNFFIGLALAMALVLVAGFSVQLAMGRSTFAAPLLTHVHALVFFGWVVIFVVQSTLGSAENERLHRRLGWLATGWIAVMVVLGTMTTIALVQRGAVPFFFVPQFFLIADPATVIGFAALSYTAVAIRRRTDWHRRLHVCAMAFLMGPGFGRLLPMPFMGPYAFEIAFAAGLVFPLAGAVRDRVRDGRVHPAWWSGLAVLAATMPLVHLVAYSSVGATFYSSAVAGTPGASVDPLAYPPPPAP